MVPLVILLDTLSNMLPGREEFINKFSDFFMDLQNSVRQIQQAQRAGPAAIHQNPVEDIIFPTRVHKLVSEVKSLERNTTGPLSLHEIIRCADPFLQNLETAMQSMKHALNLFVSTNFP